jgi:hypothetical protein
VFASQGNVPRRLSSPASKTPSAACCTWDVPTPPPCWTRPRPSF